MTLTDLLKDDFVPLADYAWHVLRVPYGREREVAAEIATDDCVPYVPVVRIQNLLFLYTTAEHVQQLLAEPVTFPEHPRWHSVQLHRLYDHTRHTPYGRDIPMTIPFDQMRSFILVTMLDDELITLLPECPTPLTEGTEVEVIGGRFAGVRGRLARLRRQTCVIVSLQGVCCVSTAYIPKAFIRPL